MRSFLIVPVLVLIAAVPLAAQTLGAGAAAPVADGVVASAEYPSSFERAGSRVSYALSADGATLYLALDAPTSGWVALGLGSARMDRAAMVMAYDDGKTPVVSEQTGKGHGHAANADRKLLASAVRENAGRTVLEFSIPAASLIDASGLKVLLAYGGRDNFTSYHAKRDTMTLLFPK